MDGELLVGLAAAPVIAALLQVVKPFLRDDRLWPVASIVLGVIWNVGVNAETRELGWAAAVLLGVLVGLAASGMYSTVKTYGVPVARPGQPEVPPPAP